MTQDKYILVRHYCEKTRIADNFIGQLHEFGIIRCREIEAELYITDDDIPEIERFDRLHRDLGINLEGIDALNNMMRRMRNMENEMEMLKKRLRLYE